MSHKPNLGIALLIVGIIIIGLSTVLLFSGKKTTKLTAPELSPEPIAEEPALEIADVKLCYSVDENYDCAENIKGEYEPINFVDLLIRVEGLKAEKSNGQYKIMYSQSREIIDPNNKVVESKVIIDKEDTVASEGTYALNMKNDFFLFDNAQAGEYIIKIIVFDKNTGKSVTISKRFRVI